MGKRENRIQAVTFFPPYHSSNHHTVSLYGRLFFIVSSNSRAGLVHFVDLERTNYPDSEGRERFFNSICTCEAWKYGERPCRHIAACFEAIAEWAQVRPAVREEWIERLMFLLNMGHSFTEALQSESLTSLRPVAPPKPEPPARKVRPYTLHRNRIYKASNKVGYCAK